MLLAEMSVVIEETVQRHLQKGKVALTTTLEHRQHGLGDAKGRGDQQICSELWL